MKRLSKRTTIFAVLIAAGAIGTALFLAVNRTDSIRTDATAAAPTAPAAPDAEPTTLQPVDRPCRDDLVAALDVSDDIAHIVADMTIEQKIRQLFIIGFHGMAADTVDANLADFNERILGATTLADAIADNGIGGVILFGRNIENADQLTAMASEIQAEAAVHKIPGLFVVVDHEGGQVTRLKTDITNYPSAPVLGALGDIDLIGDVAAATAVQLRELGVNVILAPVADLAHPDGNGTLDDRAFGEDAVAVAEAVTATVEGFAAHNVAGAVKHFPGLGSALIDSHVAMPSLTLRADEWATNERIPFEAAIDANVPIVLVGHTRFAALDASNTPSTASSDVITGELRHCLGFTGVIMTDALDMSAVGSIGSQGEAAVAALAAGADLILAPRSIGEVTAAVAVAIDAGQLTTERIDETVGRLLTLKRQLGILDATSFASGGGADAVGQPEHVEVLSRVQAACAAAGINDC